MAKTSKKGLSPDPFSPGEDSEQPSLGWKVKGKAIVLTGATWDYVIRLDRCDTLEKVLDWVVHLSEKTWVTAEMLGSFIELAVDANKLPFKRGVA